MTARDAGHPTRATEAFFGRRKGPRLRPHQAGLLEEVLPPLKLDPGAPAPGDPRDLFDRPVEEVRLEIGFGGGEHLIHRIREAPDTGFVGVEPFVNGMVKLLAELNEAERARVRLYDDDAVQILDWLPTGRIAGIDLLYPDPWPKTRHFKRRFLNGRNLDRMARVMRSGARLRFASDIESYVNWALLHILAHPDFSWPARRAADWHTPFAGWPGTRYERKAIREGRRPAYLSFVRA